MSFSYKRSSTSVTIDTKPSYSHLHGFDSESDSDDGTEPIVHAQSDSEPELESEPDSAGDVLHVTNTLCFYFN